LFGTRAVYDVQRLAYAAADFASERGRWPTTAELLASDATLPRRDRWGHEFRFDASNDRFVATTAGIDGEFGTCDDVRSDPMRPESALPKGTAIPGR